MEKLNTLESYILKAGCNILQAKLLVAKAAERSELRDEIDGVVRIYADSQAGLRTLTSRAKSKVAMDCSEDLS